MSTTPGKLSVFSEASYRISVLGFLDETMTDRLSGLEIESQEQDPESGKSIIILSGRLTDQAALFGVLNTLYNLRMPLLSVEYMGVNERKRNNYEK